MGKLTDKQEQFCKEYLVDLNATQAAIRAGYSENTAKETGYENLTKPHIQEKIRTLKEERSKKVEVTAEDVLRELKKIGFSNAASYRESWDDLKDWDNLTEDEKAAISEISTTVSEWEKGTKTKITFKLYSKLDALEKIAKHIGFYEVDNKQKSGEYDPSKLSADQLIEFLKLQDKMRDGQA